MHFTGVWFCDTASLLKRVVSLHHFPGPGWQFPSSSLHCHYCSSDPARNCFFFHLLSLSFKCYFCFSQAHYQSSLTHCLCASLRHFVKTILNSCSVFILTIMLPISPNRGMVLEIKLVSGTDYLWHLYASKQQEQDHAVTKDETVMAVGLVWDVDEGSGNFLYLLLKLCWFQRYLIQDYKWHHVGADLERRQPYTWKGNGRRGCRGRFHRKMVAGYSRGLETICALRAWLSQFLSQTFWVFNIFWVIYTGNIYVHQESNLQSER